jgi:hypothetical protein
VLPVPLEGREDTSGLSSYLAALLLAMAPSVTLEADQQGGSTQLEWSVRTYLRYRSERLQQADLPRIGRLDRLVWSVLFVWSVFVCLCVVCVVWLFGCLFVCLKFSGLAHAAGNRAVSHGHYGDRAQRWAEGFLHSRYNEVYRLHRVSATAPRDLLIAHGMACLTCVGHCDLVCVRAQRREGSSASWARLCATFNASSRCAGWATCTHGYLELSALISSSALVVLLVLVQRHLTS